MNPEIRKPNQTSYFLLSLYMYVKYLIWWSLCRELYGIGRGEPAMPYHTHIDMKFKISLGNCLVNPRSVLYSAWSENAEEMCDLFLKIEVPFWNHLNHELLQKSQTLVKKGQKIFKKTFSHFFWEFCTFRQWQQLMYLKKKCTTTHEKIE